MTPKMLIRRNSASSGHHHFVNDSGRTEQRIPAEQGEPSTRQEPR